MISFKFLVSAAGCAALAACAIPTEAPPSRSMPGEGAAFASAADRHRVIGSGHSSVALTDAVREFTFHAIEHPDGSVSGSYRIERTDTGAFFVVEVSCMSVVGNKGFVAGHIVETNIATVVVGSVSYFWAVDNGEGGDAQDVVSIARINDRQGADVEFCTTRPERLAAIPVEFGNVQVR